jgi:hypothetical protein
LLAGALVFVAGAFAIAPAQEMPEGNIVRVFFIKAKTGMEEQLADAIKEHAAIRKEENDPWEWYVWTVVNGNNLGTIVVRSGLKKWSDFDEYKFYPDRVTNHWRDTVAPLVAKEWSEITEVDLENVRWPEDESKAKYVEVYKYYLKPEKVMQFTKAYGLVHKAVIEANWDVHYAWEMIANGGSGPCYYLDIPFENWAAMKGPDKELGEVMVEVYGEEKAGKIFDMFYGSIYKYESMMVAFQPDMSVIHEEEE